MKYIIGCLFFPAWLYAQSISYEILPQPLAEFPQSVYFLDAERGFACGYYGDLIRTDDGAAGWSLLDSLTYFPLHDLHFPTDLVGYAVGGASNSAICAPLPCTPKVLKTADGGDHWIELAFPNQTARELYSVWFIHPDTGWVAGLGMLYQTTDGGQNWQAYPLSPSNQNIAHIRFLDAQNGFYSGLFGRMYKTTDGGGSWSPLNVGVSTHLYCFDFANSQIGFAAGQGKIIRTTDGGSTWTTLSNSPLEVYGLQCLSPDFVVACGRGAPIGFGGNYGMLAWTNDGGQHWTIRDSIESTLTLTDLHFPDISTGYATGRNQIVKINTGLVPVSEAPAMENDWLVYPNPAQTEVFVEHRRGAVIGAEVWLFDATGKAFFRSTIRDKQRLRIPLGHAPAGWYGYRIVDQNGNISAGAFIRR